MKTVLEQALEALEATLHILYEDMSMAGGPDEYAAVRSVILQTNDAIAALKRSLAEEPTLKEAMSSQGCEHIKQQGEPMAWWNGEYCTPVMGLDKDTPGLGDGAVALYTSAPSIPEGYDLVPKDWVDKRYYELLDDLSAAPKHDVTI